MTGRITEAKYLELRKEKVLPLFEDFHKWLLEKGEREEILGSSKTAKANDKSPEDYLCCLFEQAPYAETELDWEKLLPWNIEITPFELRGEWLELAK